MRTSKCAGYRCTVELPLEDERGVDRYAIRQRLRLTPAERVQRLVEEVEVWTEIRRVARSG